MADNITAMSRIKHLGIRYKYLNEYVEDSTVEIVFIKSAENDSNMLMKNISQELQDKH